MTNQELLRVLLFECLALEPGGRISIVSDEFNGGHAQEVLELSRTLGMNCDMHLTGYDGGDDLEPELSNCLLAEREVPCLFLVEEKTVWHTKTRILGKEMGKRFSTFLCSLAAIQRAGTWLDATLVQSIAAGLLPLLSLGAAVKISSPAGTALEATIGDGIKSRVFCEDGNYSERGGDFPFGELGFAPEPGTVFGTLVYDWKVKHFGVVNDPLVLSIEADRIVSVEGADAARFVETNLWHKGLFYLAEISLGLNPRAGFSPDPSHIVEEKQLGCMHFGHGSNSSYGTRHGGPHFDGVIRCPTLVVGDQRVIDSGRIVRHHIGQGAADALGDLVAE